MLGFELYILRVETTAQHSQNQQRGHMSEKQSDMMHRAAVVGGGPAGLVAALLLARAGAAVTHFAPPMAHGDTRTTALLQGSVALLEALDVWAAVREKAAALNVMRLIDATGRLIRAPEVSFDSNEMGHAPFGYNVRNADLVAVLAAHTAANARITTVALPVNAVDVRDDHVALACAGADTHKAGLVAAADGRNSMCRAAAGIAVSHKPYDQTALAFDITHTLDHGHVSTEFHTQTGPFTFVPLPGHASSIVWVVRPAEAARLMALDDAAIMEEVRRCSFAFLGDITSVGPRAAFPLGMASAYVMGKNRIALVGEAGHVVPPIGAQGLNLGFRDAAALADVVEDALAAGRDPGGPQALADYDGRRKADVASRAMTIDLLNRSVLSPFLPVQAARGAGLYALSKIGALRRLAMNLGMNPPGKPPRLMRREVKPHGF